MKMHDSTKIGEFIKFFRLTRNLTQAELAEDICSRELISKIESGVVKSVSFFVLARLAHRLEISMEEILGIGDDTIGNEGNHEVVESMIFNETLTSDFEKFIVSNNELEHQYLVTLTRAYGYFTDKDLPNLHRAIDEYFELRGDNYMSVNDIRLVAQRMRMHLADPTIGMDQLMLNNKLIVTLVLTLMRLKPDRRANSWINAALIVVDLAKLYNQQEIALQLLNICDQIINERHLWKYRAESELIHAGIDLDKGDYDLVMSRIMEAEKIYNMFGLKVKKKSIKFFKDVVTAVKEMDSIEGITQEEIDLRLKLIKEAHGKLI